jgi:hypothetical protein
MDNQSFPGAGQSAVDERREARVLDTLSELRLSYLGPPAPHGYGGPDRFDHAERPSALKKSVHRAERAGDSER